ncbi:potassium channel family protein [Kaistella jeonii]|uniref:Potassium channel domain-containing protein n=1 Tax=Kaistella jeonii TaxID=266749 RepID=A0A0C1FAD0_9FLAO|nr:potassium channel family protein [Kaistella jeonii]KIA88863.1 hypothetical protein OA86_09460 [Kaistella jeonii]SFC12868.1 voltage-gated potassium channel [Kaistella jeonii]VEI94480.1 Ion channel [Kaistella jeonii]
MLIPTLSTFWREKRYRQLTVSTIGVLVLGIIGYHFLEGWSWLDCINYAVSIMVTTGNAEVYPKSDWGKIFNVFYMVLSVFLILFFINTLQQHFHESRQSGKIKRKRHQKIIEKKITTQLSDDE